MVFWIFPKNDQKYTIVVKCACFCSYFGRIQNTIKTFRNQLTLKHKSVSQKTICWLNIILAWKSYFLKMVDIYCYLVFICGMTNSIKLHKMIVFLKSLCYRNYSQKSLDTRDGLFLRVAQRKIDAMLVFDKILRWASMKWPETSKLNPKS